jgi:hypothetical protein
MNGVKVTTDGKKPRLTMQSRKIFGDSIYLLMRLVVGYKTCQDATECVRQDCRRYAVMKTCQSRVWQIWLAAFS